MFSYQYRLGQKTGNETISVWFVSSFWNCLGAPGQVLKIEHVLIQNGGRQGGGDLPKACRSFILALKSLMVDGSMCN
jgi:hypothetical protein